MIAAGIILLIIGLILFLLSIFADNGCLVAILGTIFCIFGAALLSNGSKRECASQDLSEAPSIVVRDVDRFQVDTTVTTSGGTRDTTYTLRCYRDSK